MLSSEMQSNRVLEKFCFGIVTGDLILGLVRICFDDMN